MSLALLQPNDNTLETAPSAAIRAIPAFSQSLQVVVATTKGVPILLSSMECFHSVVNATNPTIELGIYTWDGAGGGTLLSSGTAVPTAAGWLKVTFASPVKLAARTKYYMAYLNRTVSDSTTTVGSLGTGAIHVLLTGLANGQATMPGTLPTLTTTGTHILVLRAWS